MKFSYRPIGQTSSAVAFPESKRYLSPRLSSLLLAVTAVSIALNILTFWFWIFHRGPSNPLFSQAVYSPAQDVLEYKAVKFHSGFGSQLPIYDQAPSDEVDEAWQSLYEFAYSKIPRTQAIHLPNKTYPILGDEPATYMLALSVFHELHCLDELRKAMYPDYYTDTTQGTSHMLHCLSSLRQSIMCSADVSAIVWQWSEKSQAAKERSDIVHSCRDFNKIYDWSKQHFAGAMQNMSIYIPDDLEPSRF
ncbi:hypothetical protein C8J57DRAFT_37175 [Mycena rebaudengoi]|nr:hypothetical protein C8J57DRAFT_37175 [Mycena rebaudengoi]